MAPQIPMAWARSRRSLKVLEMIDRVVGKITAAPTPMTRRAAMRPPVVPAAAPAAVPGPKRARTVARAGRPPQRFERLPAVRAEAGDVRVDVLKVPRQ